MSIRLDPPTNVSLIKYQCFFDPILSFELTDLGCVDQITPMVCYKVHQLHSRHFLRCLSYKRPSKKINEALVQEIDVENTVKELVNRLAQYFGSYYGYRKIDSTCFEHKTNHWRLSQQALTDEIIKRWFRLEDSIVEDRLFESILFYNAKCNEEEYEDMTKVHVKCKRWKFWLGMNFPSWLDSL